MLSRYSRKLVNSPLQGWLLFGVGLALVLHFLIDVTSLFAQEEVVYQGRTPEAVMEQIFESAPPEIETELLLLSRVGDYAIADYRRGEGGGFVVMKREENQWQTICGSGGAPDGGQTFVEHCDVPIVDAQALWEQYVEDGEAAGYVF